MARLTVDLDEDDLEDILAMNVNYNYLRRLLPPIKALRPDRRQYLSLVILPPGLRKPYGG